MKSKHISVLVLPVMFLFSFGIVKAEVTHPYVIDEKPQVLFADSVATSTYMGLENYVQDYVNGYAHIKFTYTHNDCCYSVYSPIIHVSGLDPRTVLVSNLKAANFTYFFFSTDPSDWYSVDVQFDTTGYQVVVKRAGIVEISNTHTDVFNPTDTDWVYLANNYPISNPPLPYSMSFTPVLVKAPTLTGDSNVLFIPGLEASRLYKQKTVLGIPVEDQLWEPNFFGEVDDLYLDTNGNSITQGIFTKDVIDTASFFGLFPVDIYKQFILNLDNLVNTNKISDWKAYAYDWRQGVYDLINNGTKYNNDQTFTLIGTLQSLVDSSKNGKVTIITHSNGGLIAKALIKKLEDMKTSGTSDLIDHIDTVILVASPQVGTPDALAGLLNGYKQTIPGRLMTESQARKLAENMPSAYGLLPSKKYFDQFGIGFPGVFSSTSPQIYKNTYSTDINNYQEEHNFILGLEGRTEPLESDLVSPIIGNGTLLTNAETLHNSIDNMVFPPSIKLIEIAGWGKETLSGITYTNSDIQPINTIRGDGTVVMQSSLYGPGTKYWLDLSNSKLSHKNILEDQQLLDFIDNTIEQKPPTSSNITSSEPVVIGNRLHLSVHSPVAIGAHDSQGNFTGKICDTVTLICSIVEDIPGSTYTEFGEGKYLNLPENGSQNIQIKGTDSGTFTFNIDEFHGDNEITGTTFKDIPVSTSTEASINIQTDISTLSKLNVDSNGDGNVDLSLNPKLGGVVIIPQPLNVSADKKTITLGDNIPSLTATLSGFVNGDTVATNDVTGKAQCSSTATKTSSVGTYPISCSIGTLLSNNYIFQTFVPSTLTINYRFDGFLQPINDTAHQIGQDKSVFKAGSTVPVKLQLKKADGTVVQSITAPVWLTPQQGSSMSTSVDESVYSDTGTSGTAFKWDSTSQQYIYNWSTKGLASGFWYKISVKLDDGNIYSVTVGLK